MKKLKFRGDFVALTQLLTECDYLGIWWPEPNDVMMLRCPDGINIHWAEGSKTLWVDGKNIYVDSVRNRLRRVLDRRARGSMD